MQRAFVTGAAGFIGSSLCDRLLRRDWEVIGWDNFSTGQTEFVQTANQNRRFRLVTGDNLDLKHLTDAIASCDSYAIWPQRQMCDLAPNILGKTSSKTQSTHKIAKTTKRIHTMERQTQSKFLAIFASFCASQLAQSSAKRT